MTPKQLRDARSALYCVRNLRTALRFVKLGLHREAIERWGAARLLQGAANGYHDGLLSKAAAHVLEIIFATSVRP